MPAHQPVFVTLAGYQRVAVMALAVSQLTHDCRCALDHEGRKPLPLAVRRRLERILYDAETITTIIREAERG